MGALTTRRQGFRYAASADALFTVAACIAVVRRNIEMKEPTPDIRPATLALKQLSKTRPFRPMPRYDGTHHSILLLPGPDSVTPPSAALFDTVLQPVDKVVYLVAMTIACQCNDDAYLPPQAELARMANVSSTDTVWRALSILRCTRWLVASQKKCCRGNRHEPCVYVVNATPLPIADTLFLDPDYLVFLEKCTKHIHARVRSVAGVVLSQLPGDSAIGQREQAQSLAR
jgi:hypothetical protein